MARGGGRAQKGKPQRIAKVGVKRENGFLYFVDKDGDVAKAKMAKPGSRRKSVRRARRSAHRVAPRRAVAPRPRAALAASERLDRSGRPGATPGLPSFILIAVCCAAWLPPPIPAALPTRSSSSTTKKASAKASS